MLGVEMWAPFPELSKERGGGGETHKVTGFCLNLPAASCIGGSHP